MRIGIDGRPLMHSEIRGFARYTLELFRALRELPALAKQGSAREEIELYSFSPAPIAAEFAAQLPLQQVVFTASREMLWEQIELPRQLRRHGIEIYHCTANRGLPLKQVCPYVLTCHDIIDRLPQLTADDSRRSRWRKKYSDWISRQSAAKYITVSNFSKQDICRFHNLPESRVEVIYNAANPRFYQPLSPESVSATKRKYALPENYWLFLGGFDKRKNAQALIEAYSLLPTNSAPLVLAGEHKWEFSAVAERIRALNLANRIFCPNTIADDDLPALYKGAKALVHPSLYEGFGLQLVEAMASGVPVLASATTSLPEILGGAGLLFDPENPEEIAVQMRRIAEDAALHKSLSEKSRERAEFFSWRKAAEETLQVYRELRR